jgi:flagellar brake protein
MSQLAQLSEAEIEERFHISSARAIQFMLADLISQREPFSVQFGAARESFQTILLAVQADNDRLVFDCCGSQEINQRFLKSDHNVFMARPGGIQVHFVGGPAIEINFEGAKAFAVKLPKTLARLQRREYFRIETPRVRPLELFARRADNVLFKCALHDISVSGIGLTASSLPEGLAVGEVWQNCRLQLPEDANDLFFVVTVRNIIELEARAGVPQFRIGLEFNDLSTREANRIQRYISRLEHERRDLA